MKSIFGLGSIFGSIAQMTLVAAVLALASHTSYSVTALWSSAFVGFGILAFFVSKNTMIPEDKRSWSALACSCLAYACAAIPNIWVALVFVLVLTLMASVRAAYTGHVIQYGNRSARFGHEALGSAAAIVAFTGASMSNGTLPFAIAFTIFATRIAVTTFVEYKTNQPIANATVI